MYPADFYALVCRDRRRAAQHLLCYDPDGLSRLAADCAAHLFERFGVRIPPEHVLETWERVGLVSMTHARAAMLARERAVGE